MTVISVQFNPGEPDVLATSTRKNKQKDVETTSTSHLHEKSTRNKAGVPPLLQHQFEELSKQKLDDERSFGESKRRKLVVIGQECIESLQALSSAVQKTTERRRSSESLGRKRKEEKKRYVINKESRAGKD